MFMYPEAELSNLIETDDRSRRVARCGFYALRVAQANSVESLKKSVEQARSKFVAAAYVGSWALIHLGVKPKEIFSRLFFQEGYELMGGGYEALVIRSPEGGLEKIFHAPLLLPDVDSHQQLGELHEDLGLLQKFLGDRVAPTQLALAKPPFKEPVEVSLPIASQQEIVLVLSALDREVDKPLINISGEARLRKDIRVIALGGRAIYASSRRMPDLLGRDNVLIHDDGSALRATLVDVSFGTQRQELMDRSLIRLNQIEQLVA